MFKIQNKVGYDNVETCIKDVLLEKNRDQIKVCIYTILTTLLYNFSVQFCNLTIDHDAF